MSSLAFRCVFCDFLFKQKTAYELRISDWSSDVCSSDLFRNFISYIEIYDMSVSQGAIGDNALARACRAANEGHGIRDCECNVEGLAARSARARRRHPPACRGDGADAVATAGAARDRYWRGVSPDPVRRAVAEVGRAVWRVSGSPSVNTWWVAGSIQ